MSLQYEVDEREFDYGEFASQLDYIKYSRDVEHRHSKGAQLILDLSATYIERSEKAFAEGKNAVWSMGWEPLAYACDTIPITLNEIGRVVGDSNATAIAESRFQLPPESCGMIKSSLGELYLRKNRVNRLLGSSALCEPYNQALEMLKSEGYDVHFVDVPAYDRRVVEEKDEKEFVKYISKELSLAAEWLNHGKKLDEGKLSIELKRSNQVLKKIKKIMALRIKKPLFIGNLVTMYTTIGGAWNYFGDPVTYMKALDLLIEELEAAPEEKYKSDNLIPILWVGARSEEFGIFKTLDDMNAVILGWAFPRLYYDENFPPLESMARTTLNMWTGVGRFSRWIDDSLIWLNEQGVTVRGAIIYGRFGCPINTSELSRTHLAKKGINGFIIDGNFQIGPPTGQLITRIKAFVEMLSVRNPKLVINKR